MSLETARLNRLDGAIDASSGVWPQGDSDCGYFRDVFPNVTTKTHFTRAEFEARKAERQKKPSWKGAPEWAQWLAQDMNGDWFFYCRKPLTSMAHICWCNNGQYCTRVATGEVIGDWHDTREQRPTNSTCVADGLREIREAFVGWGVSIAGAQVAHKGATPNGMHKLEVTFDENHIVESDEKAAQELKFAETIKDVYPGRAAEIYCKHMQSAIDSAEVEKAVKACERAFAEFFPEAKLPDWYDYENKKALQLPPVGVECEMYGGGTWFVITVVGLDGGRPVVRYHDTGAYHSQSNQSKFYRPLDWGRLSPKPEPEQSPELSFHLSNAFNELQASARLLPDDDARKPMLVSLANGVNAVREGV